MTDGKQLSEVDFLKYMESFKKGVYGKFNNQNRELGEIATGLENVKDDVKALEEKSDRWDRLNSIGIFVGGLVGGLIGAVSSFFDKK